LMLAAQAGDEGITRLLLDVGADPNRVHSVSYCPTQSRLCSSMTPEFTQKVRRKTNGNVCKCPQEGWTAFIKAAANGHMGIVHWLLHTNAKVDAQHHVSQGSASRCVAFPLTHLTTFVCVLVRPVRSE
jgi:hypothetical protein